MDEEMFRRKDIGRNRSSRWWVWTEDDDVITAVGVVGVDENLVDSDCKGADDEDDEDVSWRVFRTGIRSKRKEASGGVDDGVSVCCAYNKS